jgi:hypothetical protein
MGSQSSKVAAKAAGAAGRRQYPSTSSILDSAKSTSPTPSSSAGPPSSVRPSPQNAPPSSNKSEHIDLDARDPHFGSALRQAGIARRVPQHTSATDQSTFPTSSVPPAAQQAPDQNIFPSQSASTNPAIALVAARERWAALYNSDNDNLGRPNYEGRQLLTIREVKDVLRAREDGSKSLREMEKTMRLKPGILDKLGREGVVMNV